jgi:hypothetical protein
MFMPVRDDPVHACVGMSLRPYICVPNCRWNGHKYGISARLYLTSITHPPPTVKYLDDALYLILFIVPDYQHYNTVLDEQSSDDSVLVSDT